MAREKAASAVTKPVCCVVVDDHLMVLQLLCGALRTLGGIEVVATATAVGDAARLQSTRAVDLLVLDACLADGDGFDLLRALVQTHPGLRCVVIEDTPQGRECPADLTEHVVAVVRKTEPCDALFAAIQQAVGDRVGASHAFSRANEVRGRLTARERDVFASLGKGLSNKEIGTDLGISVQTVETHRKSIARKLGCNGASLVRLATLAHYRGLP